MLLLSFIVHLRKLKKRTLVVYSGLSIWGLENEYACECSMLDAQFFAPCETIGPSHLAKGE